MAPLSPTPAPIPDLESILKDLDFSELTEYFHMAARADLWRQFFTPDRLTALHQIRASHQVHKLLTQARSLAHFTLEIRNCNYHASKHDRPALHLTLPNEEACRAALQLWHHTLPPETTFAHNEWRDPIAWTTLPLSLIAPEIFTHPLWDLTPELHIGYPHPREISAAEINITQGLDSHGKRRIQAFWTGAPYHKKVGGLPILEVRLDAEHFNIHLHHPPETLIKSATRDAWSLITFQADMPRNKHKEDRFYVPDHIVWTHLPTV